MSEITRDAYSSICLFMHNICQMGPSWPGQALPNGGPKKLTLETREHNGRFLLPSTHTT